MTLQEYRPLIVRSNRALGSMLLDRKLITSEQLDTANEKFVENIESGDVRRANILHVLLFDLQVLNEDAYLETIIEKYSLGLIDLHSCQFKKTADLQIDPMPCWVTWTVPFDAVDDFVMLASLFYPSPPVVKFWQDKYAGRNLIWYATSARSFQAAMERLDQLKTEAARTALFNTAPSKPSAASAKNTTAPMKPTRNTKSPVPAKK